MGIGIFLLEAIGLRKYFDIHSTSVSQTYKLIGRYIFINIRNQRSKEVLGPQIEEKRW